MTCLSHQDGSECDLGAREMVKAGESLALRLDDRARSGATNPSRDREEAVDEVGLKDP